MQTDFQPRVSEGRDNAFRHLFGVLRSDFMFWLLSATLANCSRNYRIHLMGVIHSLALRIDTIVRLWRAKPPRLYIVSSMTCSRRSNLPIGTGPLNVADPENSAAGWRIAATRGNGSGTLKEPFRELEVLWHRSRISGYSTARRALNYVLNPSERALHQ